MGNSSLSEMRGSVLSVLVGLLSLVCPTSSILCDTDQELDNLQEFTYDLEHDASDMSFWRTYHNSFFVYGEYTGGDATVEAGYYTSAGALIYSVKIDCAANTWMSFVTDKDAEEDTTREWLNGELETSCEDGDMFDIILKIQQPRLMNWIYDAQAFQYDTQTTKFRKERERERALAVPTKYGADFGSQFRVSTTGSAVLTRFAFGKCVIW